MKTIANIFIALIVMFVLVNVCKVMLPLIASFMIFVIVVAGGIYIWKCLKRCNR